jgi:hypothetical protein
MLAAPLLSVAATVMIRGRWQAVYGLCFAVCGVRFIVVVGDGRFTDVTGGGRFTVVVGGGRFTVVVGGGRFTVVVCGLRFIVVVGGGRFVRGGGGASPDATRDRVCQHFRMK